MLYQIKHYFGTTSALSSPSERAKKKKKKRLSVRREIERLMRPRDSPPAQSLLHTLSAAYYWFNL